VASIWLKDLLWLTIFKYPSWPYSKAKRWKLHIILICFKHYLVPTKSCDVFMINLPFRISKQKDGNFTLYLFISSTTWYQKKLWCVYDQLTIQNIKAIFYNTLPCQIISPSQNNITTIFIKTWLFLFLKINKFHSYFWSADSLKQNWWWSIINWNISPTILYRFVAVYHLTRAN
jgi:hypothetical protein